MPERRPRIYLDSSCYIALLKGEQPHVSDLRRIVEDARLGRSEMVASTMCITESIKLPGGPVIDRERSEGVIRGFFENPWILIRTHDRWIAEQGRELCWDHGLHPRDAIHVASAIDTRCEVLFTTDEKLLRRCETIPGIRVKKPKWTGQLTIEDCEP